MDARPWPPGEPSRSPRHDGDGSVTAIVCAAFDAEADDAVLAVREQARVLGVRLATRPNHRPHVTLTGVRVDPDAVGRVVKVARGVAARHTPFVLRLGTVGGFGRSGALWLGPDRDAEIERLRALQAHVDAAVGAAGLPAAFAGRSAPDGWVPHCTLATRLRPPGLREAERAVCERYVPISATVAALAVILVGACGDVALLPLRGGADQPSRSASSTAS